MKTFVAKPHEVNHQWHLIDAKNQRLGRLAADIAMILRGKHKPEYTPHVDTGDYVVVINSKEIVVTGKKKTDKIYYRHSGYVGGIKAMSFEKMQANAPGRVLELAVKGMLPKGPLGREMFRKLKVFAGETHQHTAQTPQCLPKNFLFRTSF